MVLVPADAVGAVGMPVRDGLARDAFKSKAVCVAVEMGLSASDVLFTLPKPTMVAVMPLTVPVKVGPASDAFKSKAVCVAVETGLSASAVLFTLPKPTMVAVMPLTVPVKVGPARGAFKSNAVLRFDVSVETADVTNAVVAI